MNKIQRQEKELSPDIGGDYISFINKLSEKYLLQDSEKLLSDFESNCAAGFTISARPRVLFSRY